MWLSKCLKSLVSEHCVTVNMLNSLKSITTTLPSYRFITLAKTELENILCSVSKILRVFVNTFTADDKYFLHNSKNSRLPIQLQSSKKEKICSQLSAKYLKSTSNVEHFEKKRRLS